MLIAAAVALLAFPAAEFASGRATLRVLSAVGMRQALLDLGPTFERASGHAINISFESSGVISKRLDSGEAIDVVLMNQAGIDRSMRAGRISAGSVAPLATAIVGLAVRTGDAKPDIATAAAFTSAMLRARRISYPDPGLDGSSGVHIANVFERLGITTAMTPKTIYADPPAPGAATPASIVAAGRADIALHQLQELRAAAGITVVGPLPDDLQQTFVFSAAIPARASNPEAAQALIDFLQTRESQATFIAKGMGRPPPR
jgi:molybdate transport system substrate-binding protein